MKQLLFLILFTFSLNGYGLDYKEITKKYIDENQSKLIAPGSVVALVKDGRVEHFQTIGKRDVENSLPVERETVFRIGSLTKTFTATAIVQLREKGLLKLDDLVEDTIHELRALAYPYPDSPKITIRHLLTHSSGLIRHPMPLDQSVNGLIKELLNPALGTSFVEDGSGMSWYPGYAYLYSNVGITLLGEVVTRISGMDVSDYIKQEILAPLGMDNTYWHESEVPSDLRSFPYDYKDNDWQKKADWDLKGYSAAGSIYSNIDDLAKWMNLQFQSHPRDLPRILSPFIINEMHRVQVVESSFDSKRGTGLVWYTKGVDNEKIVGHNGATGGYMAYFGFSKKEKFGVIVLSSNGRADTTGFGEGIIEAVLKELKKERLEDIKVVAEKLLPYLKLEMTEDFQDIFEQGLFDYAGSDEGWSQLLSSINTKHGLPESIQEIIPTANGRGIVKIKTTKGIISYKIVISLDNPEKLSGLLLYNFKSY